MRTCTHWYIQGGASSISNFIRCHCRATSRSRASPIISISLWIKSRLEISIEETFVIERKKSERLADRFRRPEGQAHQTPRTCAHEERAAGRPASVRACVRALARANQCAAECVAYACAPSNDFDRDRSFFFSPSRERRSV